MSPESEKRPLTLMVSSTVYGIEELLDRIYARLTAVGYEVCMSHKGALPVTSTRSTLENCLHGVAQSDVFLGLITPLYGTGMAEKGGLSIAHLKSTNVRRHHPSSPTNPDMAQVLYLKGLLERIGRGTRKIIQSRLDRGLRAPQLDDRESGGTLTHRGPAGAADDPASLTPRQRAQLQALNGDARVRRAEYHERLAADGSERQACRDVVALAELVLLRVDGAGAGTVYVRTNRT